MSDEYSLYLRKSRKDLDLEALGHGETLARHREALVELAERQGLTIGRTYEEMVSGESIADRPVMQELLDDVYAGRWRGVLVMEVERLARGNTKDQGEVAEAFAMSGTLIVTPSKTYDPNDEFDEEYFEFGLFMSRREYKTIRRRMQRGVIASVKEGNYVGSLPPYGYDVVRINKKERTLALNEQSKYVEMMFDWFVNKRLNTGEIARRLTAMGVPTKTGGPEWSRTTVSDILGNILYCGKIRWNRRKVTKEKVDGQIKKRLRRQLSENQLIVAGKHPAIVSEEMFEKAQSLFTGSVPVKATTTITNPFAGVMVCKHCGKALRYQVVHKGNTRSRMVHPESIKCKMKSAPYDDVMDAVVGALQAHVHDFEMKRYNTHLLGEKRRADEFRADAAREIKKLERRRDGLFEFLEDGTYTRAEFTERKAVIVERINALKQSIAELDAVPEVNYEEKIVRFQDVIATLRDPERDAKYKNQLLKDIVSRIEYECEDLGRNKGGVVKLDLYLKN